MSVFFALHVNDDFLMYICYRHACRNVGSEKLADGAVHVFSSCMVCFEELTFLLMFFLKWLRDKQSTLQKKRHLFSLLHRTCVGYCINEFMQLTRCITSFMK